MNNTIIDGNGFAIRNFKITNQEASGFISYNSSNITIKNLKFENCISTNSGGQKYSGIIIGKNYSNCLIENVEIINCKVICEWQAGGLVGFAEENAPRFVNCKILDSFIGGENCTSGAIFGLGEVDVNIESCVAKNVQLYTDMEGSPYVGYLYGKDLIENNCVAENVTIVSNIPD